MKPWRTAFALLILAGGGCVRLQGPPETWSCHSSSDCQPDQICTTSGKCHPAGYCETSQDCSGSDVCEGSSCVSVACSPATAGACLPYRCLGDRCLSSCLADDECLTPGSKCLASRCTEPQCSDDSACHGFVCRNGSCETSCNSAFNCAADYDCFDGLCAKAGQQDNGTPCTTNPACASRKCCMLSGARVGHCGDDCSPLPDGAVCAIDENCSSGHCVAHACSMCGPLGCKAEACSNVQCGYVNGVDCGTCPDGLLCNGVSCQTQECDLNIPVFCKDNSFYDCNRGFTGGLRSSCGDTAFCDLNSQSCLTYTCDRSRGFCSSNVYRPCDGTGHYAGGAPRNCEPLALDCTTLGCGHSHVEDVPAASGNRSNAAANTCGNLFLADKALSLLTVSQVVDAGGSEMRWFVYGADALDGIYDSALPQAFATSLQSYSPELRVALVPGRYYFIGVQNIGMGGAYGFDPPLAAPPRMAFGRLIDSFCLLNGLNTTLSDRETHGVAAQQLETVELVP